MDERFLIKIKRRDRLARAVISVGGWAVIASVIAILFLIVKVTVPLFLGAQSKEVGSFTLPELAEIGEPLAVGVDEHLDSGWYLGRRGRVLFFSLPDGRVLGQRSLVPEKGDGVELRQVESQSPDLFTLSWADGSYSLVRIAAPAAGSVESAVTMLFELPATGEGSPARLTSSRVSESNAVTLVELRSSNRLLLHRQTRTENLFGEVTTEAISYPVVNELPEKITAVTMNKAGTVLFAGTEQGTILQWDIAGSEEARLIDSLPAFRERTAITALTMVFGSESLAVGDARGGVTTWMGVREQAGSAEKKLRLIHTLTAHGAAVTHLIPSRRDKSLVSLDSEGNLALDHMTSERHLLEWRGRPLQAVCFAGRGNGMVAVDSANRFTAWQVHNPHPEVSWRTLFGKVWYESYDQPVYAWQSSSGSDDFEPKLSITPLLFGTIKGTLYAMFLAIPLAIFGAAYVSQFTTARFRKTVKPVVEIMASIPSVVIGFLAALWLAPLVERGIVSVFVAVVLVPIFFVLFMLLWQVASARLETVRHCRKGYEFLILIPVILLALLVSFQLGPILEGWWFGGDFKLWLFEAAGVRYDQRNCIIIAFGLGFTVIPIIFSIAEDSLSNVPSSLTAASLALGASRWQTVWRVVLPSASPGIFAGVMIGFGRAVGETMIILMATGNTPIMDPSIFNGMRTLAANIAVEIPEAPVDSTLYRVLFLCAVLLFVLTFILNTGAEVVRDHLRRKYMRY